MPDVLIVLSQPGPLPITATADVETDGPVALTLAGSVWSTTANTTVGFSLYIDGEPLETGATIYATAPNQHMAVVPIIVPYTFTAGTHTFSVQAINRQTACDENDVFQVTALS
jgi:hypothetical protein